MSASTGALARLLEQHEKGSFVISGDEACLTFIGLAPDAVRLLTDMAALLSERREHGFVPGRNGDVSATSLLARFAALEERAAQ